MLHEEALIGALLKSPKLLDTISERPDQSDFANEFYGRIWDCITRAYDHEAPCDVITINTALKTDYGYDSALQNLRILFENAISNKVDVYAKEIRAASIKRQISAICFDMQAMALDETIPLPDMVAEIDRRLGDLHKSAKSDDLLCGAELMRDYVAKMIENEKSGGGIAGISTGFPKLDAMTTGIRKGEMWVLAGDTGMGKTTMAITIAGHALKHDKSVLFISLEMTSEDIMAKLGAAAFSIPYSQYRRGSFDDPHTMQQLELATRLVPEWKVGASFKASTVPLIKQALRAHKRKHGSVDLLVVDYIGLMNDDRYKGDRTREMGEVSRQLKLFALNEGIGVLALAQLNRSFLNAADKRPEKHHLRDTGNIAQDADVIMMVYRDDQYHADSPHKGTGEILVRKNRHGECGTVLATFNGEMSRYEPTINIGWE